MIAQIELSGVRSRQDPLRRTYKQNPKEALINDQAKTLGGVYTDPFHGNVAIGKKEFGVVLPYGIHQAVGGFHDAPNPGDMLCGAIAACFDSAIRIIAERFGVTLTFLEVEVRAEVDVRGTLIVDRSVPIGFQRIKCNVDIQAEEGTDPKNLKKVIGAAEHSCVNVQTLLSNVSVETKVKA
jgi:uncharacterized OsmC-like protein